jgi:excisionase family DNA binding protein
VDLESHPERYLALEQLAAYWSLHVQTLRKWVREGAIPAAKFGRATRVKVVDACAFERRSRIT